MLHRFRILADDGAARVPKPPRAPKPSRPLADPSAYSWTAADLAHLFGRPAIGPALRQWRREADFPSPLPFSRRPLRWNPAAVLRWKAAREQQAGSV